MTSDALQTFAAFQQVADDHALVGTETAQVVVQPRPEIERYKPLDIQLILLKLLKYLLPFAELDEPRSGMQLPQDRIGLIHGDARASSRHFNEVNLIVAGKGALQQNRVVFDSGRTMVATELDPIVYRLAQADAAEGNLLVRSTVRSGDEWPRRETVVGEAARETRAAS